MEKALRKQGVTVIPIDHKSIIKRFFLCIKTKTDVYHTDSTFINGLLGCIAARLKGKICTITMRGKDYLFYRKERHNFISSTILGYVEYLSLLLVKKIFFVCTDTYLAYAKKYPWIKRKSIVTYNGVDYEQFSAGRKKDLAKIFPKISKGDNILIFSSNFKYKEKSKGAKLVIDAMKKLNNKTKLLICGNGESLNDVKKFAEKVKNRVIFAGFRNDLPDLLKSGSIFVYGSYLDGLPTTILEAACAELPIIANNKDGIPEAVPSQGGFIITDSENMASKVKFLLNNKKARQEMGLNARKHILKNFTWDKIMEKYVKEWKKCMNKNI